MEYIHVTCYFVKFQLADCTLQKQTIKIKIWHKILQLSDVEHVPNRECVLEHEVMLHIHKKRDTTN